MSSIGVYFAFRLTSWMPESFGFPLRNALYRLAGAKIGRKVRIYSSARILGTGALEVGDDVHVGPDVMIYVNQSARVVIGNCVDIAPRVAILTGGHEIDRDGEHIAGRGTAHDVRIGDGSWICAGTTVLGGATLGEKSLVAAGSVVRGGAYEGRSLIAGVPAKFKKRY